MTQHSHDHDHGASDHDAGETAEPGSAAQMWDEKYSSRTKMWSGQPNPQLVAEAAQLPPVRLWTWAAAKARTPYGSPPAAGP